LQSKVGIMSKISIQFSSEEGFIGGQLIKDAKALDTAAYSDFISTLVVLRKRI
jgi:hypothetical protein